MLLNQNQRAVFMTVNLGPTQQEELSRRVQNYIASFIADGPVYDERGFAPTMLTETEAMRVFGFDMARRDANSVMAGVDYSGAEFRLPSTEDMEAAPSFADIYGADDQPVIVDSLPALDLPASTRLKHVQARHEKGAMRHQFRTKSRAMKHSRRTQPKGART